MWGGGGAGLLGVNAPLDVTCNRLRLDVKCSFGIACQRLNFTMVVCWESRRGRNRLG